jgi:Whirly transcription factor
MTWRATSVLHFHSTASSPFLLQCAAFSNNTVRTFKQQQQQQQQRSFSFYPNNNNKNTSNESQLSGPSYQIYAEDAALTVRAIPPEFRALANGRIVLDSSSRGRLLLQWNPRHSDGRYQWDQSIRFALTAEEAGHVFMAQLNPQLILLLQSQTREEAAATDVNAPPMPVAAAEVVRRPNQNQSNMTMMDNQNQGTEFFNDAIPEKVFRARMYANGSVQLLVDYERDGIGGQEPPTSNETVSNKIKRGDVDVVVCKA